MREIMKQSQTPLQRIYNFTNVLFKKYQIEPISEEELQTALEAVCPNWKQILASVNTPNAAEKTEKKLAEEIYNYLNPLKEAA